MHNITVITAMVITLLITVISESFQLMKQRSRTSVVSDARTQQITTTDQLNEVNWPIEILNQLFVISTDEVVEKTLMHSIQCQQVACCKPLQHKHRLLLQQRWLHVIHQYNINLGW